MTGVGEVYGEALYALSLEEKLAEQVLEELAVLAQCFCAEPDFVRLLSSPSLSKQERCQVLDRSFRGKVQPYVLNFLKLLTEKGYAKHFCDCFKTFEALYDRDNGILRVSAVTAVALTPEQAEKLTARLSRLTGKQIKLINAIDPSVLGGVRLDYGGKCLDDTVSHRMEAICKALGAAAL